MIILGIDSGVERTGYALFEKIVGKETLLDYGCLITKKEDTLSVRLSILQKEFSNLIEKYHPGAIAIEQLFFSKNQKTAISVAQSQGVLLALAGAEKIPITFISPLTIKQSVTGYGKSDKKGVAKMIQILLTYCYSLNSRES
ncbi:MAG: crossover junction endodeoxyribonuclease RuvC, partial [Candidatus Roizmanbacteria bacterium]